MTVKLTKFFNSSSSATPPPLPPPNPITKHSTHQRQNQMYYQQHYTPQQQHHQQQQKNLMPHFSPHYYDVDGCAAAVDDVDDDDSMSMYSTTASIMTARDHPYNNSQRPLLPARKPTTQLLHKKKFNATSNATNNINTKAAATTAAAPHQQPQQHAMMMPFHHQQHHHQYQYPHQHQYQHQHQAKKSYISPYVQQQKRDSAKGLHGFNDFDILSQQYTQHLQSPHIGYPYGSPPSPTAQMSDFVFDTVLTSKSPMSPPLIQPRYANINNFATPNPSSSPTSRRDYYGQAVNSTADVPSSNSPDFMGKPSRFEDDFCCRRNDDFSRQQLDATSSSSSNSNSSAGSSGGVGCGGGGGPFIFGLPPAQQTDKTRRYCDSTDTVISSDKDYVGDNYSAATMTLSGKSTMQQSASDTSSSSHESAPGADVSVKSKLGAKILLLCKRKSKKKTKTDQQTADDLTKAQAKPQKPTIKCVLVGDGAVGKTNLILSYLENRFNPEHVPTASDIYNADVMVNDSPVNVTICDTAGQDTLDPLRELSYPDSDVFLLCFSVAKPETFDAIKTKWAPKFAKSKAALILVGTQADLRTNSNVLNKLQTNGEKPISYADAWDLATTIGAKYIETSSATQDKVKEVFDTAIWDGLLPSALPPTPPFWKKLFCLA